MMLTDERILEIAEAYGDMAGEYRKISFARAIQEEAYKAGMAAAVPDGWKVVPAVPTNEWVGNLAKQQSGSLEEVPFLAIHQCIAELLEASPEVK
jgi:hypothetical protein